MDLVIQLILHFAISCGLFIFAMALASGLYNNFGYKDFMKNMLAGVALGAFSMAFHFVPFSIEGVALFDFRFLLLIAAAAYYSPSLLFWFAPFFFGGVWLSYADREPIITMIIAGFMFVYALLINVLGFSRRLRAALLFIGCMPLVFSIPLATARLDNFDGKVVLMYAAVAVFFVIGAFGLFTALANRNLFGATTLSMYADSLLNAYGGIYHFTIDRGRQTVRFSKAMHDDLELSSLQLRTMEFGEFLTVFSNALADHDPDAQPENKVITGKAKDYLYITPKTNQRRYIRYICRKNLFGYYTGQIKDVTNTIEPEEMLHEILQKNHVTGFKTYHLMKEEMVEVAQKNAGLMLQAHFMISFAQMMESLYGFELEKEYFRLMSDELRREFPEALFYAVKDNEFQMLVLDIKRSDNAAVYANRLMEFFMRPCEIRGKRVSYTATVGIVVSESLRCDSIDKANIQIDKALFAKDMAFRRKEGGVYFFSEEEYENYRMQIRRGELLPAVLANNSLLLKYLPVVDTATAEVFGYEVITEARDTSMPITAEELTGDAYRFSIDRELDAAIGINLKEAVQRDQIRHNIFLPRMMNTRCGETFTDISRQLKSSGAELFVLFSAFKETDNFEIMDVVGEFSRSGIKVVIDDYGKGHCSQALVANLNPAVIMIDADLVKDIDKNTRKQIMVKTIVDYCDKLYIKCAARGVSEHPQLKKLMEAGVHYVSGSYIGSAAPRILDIEHSVKESIISLSQGKKVN